MNTIICNKQLSYLNALRKPDDELTVAIEQYAKEKNVPILDNLAADFLESLIKLKQPQRVMEIGTAIAYSSIRIARNLPENGVIDTIEVSKDAAETARKFIGNCKVKDKINLIEGDALKIIPDLEEMYDFIFLDADKEDYRQHFNNAWRLLKKSGVIFVDNLLWHGYAALDEIPDDPYVESTEHIREFNEMFMNHPDLQTTIITVGDGIGLGIKL